MGGIGIRLLRGVGIVAIGIVAVGRGAVPLLARIRAEGRLGRCLTLQVLLQIENDVVLRAELADIDGLQAAWKALKGE